MICSCVVWVEWRISFSPLLPLFYFYLCLCRLHWGSLPILPNLLFSLSLVGNIIFAIASWSQLKIVILCLCISWEIYYRLMPYNQIHAQILSLSIWGSADRCHGDIPTLIEISIIQKTIDAKSSSMRIRGLNEQNLLIKKEPDNWRIQVAKRIQPREALIAG